MSGSSKHKTINNSPRRVDFDLQNEKEDVNERKLKMDPSSAVIDLNLHQNF
jgi:hypothetical protein